MAVIACSLRFFNRTVAILAGIIIYFLPFFIEYASQAWVDISAAAFSFLAFYAFLIWKQKTDTKWLVVSGVMAGFATGTKMSGLFTAFAIGLLVLWSSFASKKPAGKMLWYAAVFGLAALLIAAPWPLKSFVHTGNPVYPWYFDVFGGRDWNEVSDQKFRGYFDERYTYKGLANFVLLPWNATMHSLEFNALLGFGPVFLAFIPLYIFLRKDQNINYVLLFSLIFTVLWYSIINPNLRYYAVYPALSVAAAYSINGFLNRKIIRYAVILLLASTLVFGAALWYGTNFKKVPFALGLESEEGFYSRLVDNNPYKAAKFVDESLPKNAKLLLFTEQRGFYFNRDYVWGQPYSQGYIYYYDISEPARLYDRLKEKGITHVMLNDNVGFFLKESNIDNKTFSLMTGMLKQKSKMIYNEDGIEIYELE